MRTGILRPIPGHPGYLASPDGQVWSVKVSKSPRRMKAFRRGRAGHLGVNLTQDGMYQMYAVHRLVALAWKGPSFGRLVMHIDDDPTNNRVSNLRYGTPAENSGLMVAHDRQARGERHGRSHLSLLQAQEIKQLLRQGHTGKRIAERFGVSTTTISQIKNSQTWKEVAD